MLIGVISDTHDNLEKSIEALDFLLQKGIFTIFHCGDWVKPDTFRILADEACKNGQKIYGVLGNNDLKYKTEFYEINKVIDQPVVLPDMGDDFLEYVYRSRKFAIYHGHVKKRLDEILSSNNFEAVFVGHTHVPKEEFVKNTKVLNPGALSYSIPFKKRNNEIFTAGTYDLNNKKFTVYEI